MKAVFLRPRFALTALFLVALATLAPNKAVAQTEGTGKTGTTIVFDYEHSQGLRGSNASGSSDAGQWFAYMRHNVAHIQIQSSNTSTLGTNGTGSFSNNDNDMVFYNTAGENETPSYDFQVANFYDTSKDAKNQDVYLAIIAPQGYRFTRYQWEVDKVLNGSTETSSATLTQYTYGTNNAVVDGATSKLATGTKWDVTLSQGANILYFRYSTNVAAKLLANFKSLKLTYVIDQPFNNQLPATDLSNNIHTGLLDLGTFSKNASNFITFDKDTPASDLQSVKFYQTAGDNTSPISPSVVESDGSQYYVAASNGDYYIEAPEKFRVIGATLTFKKISDATGTTYSYADASDITSGSAYLISDGNGHYLNLNGSAITVGTDAKSATAWTISGNYNYTIKSGSYYLVRSSSSLTTSSSSSSWSWNSNTGFSAFGQRNTYYLVYSDGQWQLTTSSTSNANKLQTRTENSKSYTACNFTATPYSRDGQALTGDNVATISDDNDEKTITLTDYNNDAIHFSISGLQDGQSAFYNVNLQLLPLNPELQNLSVGTTLGEDKTTSTSFSAENFDFNGGNAVTVIVPSTQTSDVTLQFQDAYNESRTQWYTNGSLNNDASKGNYSNYFLVNSTADNGGTSAVSLNVNSNSYPTDRTSATKAGSVKLDATNIADINSGNATQLKDNEFSKTSADYKDATLTPNGGAGTFYIYTADMPTWTTMPSGTGSKHIDYRYYTLKAQCKTQQEEAVVTLVPVYTSTLKGANHKKTTISGDGDTPATTTFFGAKVTSKAADESNASNAAELGYLTSDQVINAVRAAVAAKAEATGDDKFTVDTDDALRGLLYLDLSALKSVDNNRFTSAFNDSTADNCLYIMYPGFHRENIQNTIALKADKLSYEAVSNIQLYDQQPFFTPVAFTTGTYTVSYEREGTSDNAGTNKAKVRNMAVVLPFSVSLDNDGHLKTASDVTDSNITYHNITASGDATDAHAYGDASHVYTYAVVAEAVTDGTAEANKPYYVTKDTGADAGFSYTIAGASFAASGTVDYTNAKATADNLTNEPSDAWKAIGSYSGVQPQKGEGLWYFAQDLFWNSEMLKNNDHFNIRPFRAYFQTTTKTNESKAMVVFNENDIKPTGINDVTADDALQIAAADGTLQLTAGADTHYTVVTVAGQLVAAGQLAAAQTKTLSLAQGIYIVNNKKIIIK